MSFIITQNKQLVNLNLNQTVTFRPLFFENITYELE